MKGLGEVRFQDGEGCVRQEGRRLCKFRRGLRSKALKMQDCLLAAQVSNGQM